MECFDRKEWIRSDHGPHYCVSVRIGDSRHWRNHFSPFPPQSAGARTPEKNSGTGLHSHPDVPRKQWNGRPSGQ